MPRASTPVNGPALRATRRGHGLSVRALVARLGEQGTATAHENHIRHLETGTRNASPELINAISNALGVPVDSLTRDAPTDTPVGSR